MKTFNNVIPAKAGIQILHLLFIVGIMSACGSLADNQPVQPVAVQLALKLPAPEEEAFRSSLSKGVAFSTAKTLETATITSCTITATKGTSTKTGTATISSTTGTTSTTMDLDAGTWSFTTDCTDSSGTTNNITVGYQAVVSQNIATSATVPITLQFKNLLADSGDSNVYYARLNQPSATQTRLDIGFRGNMPDSGKADLACFAFLDPEADETSQRLTSIGTSETAVLSNANVGPYISMFGGISSLTCQYHNASNAITMRGRGVWTTDDEGDDVARCTFGITQMKSIIDSDESGQWYLACRSASGFTTTGYDFVPNSGLARYDLSPNTSTSDVSSLVIDGNSCTLSRNGEDCSSGICVANGECDSVAEGVIAGTPGNTVTAGLAAPEGLCMISSGLVVYVADTGGTGSIDKVTLTQVPAATAFCTDTQFALGAPIACAITSDDKTMYVADTGNNKILKLTIGSSTCSGVETFAGNSSNTAGTSDGTGTGAFFSAPVGIAIDHADKALYIADRGNQTIRKIVIATKVVTTLAGKAGTTGTTNGTGTDARFNTPYWLALDPTDTNLYVTDQTNNSIRKINLGTSAVTTLSITGTINLPNGIIVDPTNTSLYITQNTAGSANNLVKVGVSGGTLTEVAGTAQWANPEGMAFHPTGNPLYIADVLNFRIRSIASTSAK